MLTKNPASIELERFGGGTSGGVTQQSNSGTYDEMSVPLM
jgi:hypothetical protein